MRIFVYEPEKSLCNLFKYYLEDFEGHEVYIFCKEMEALAEASVSSFDLYILAHSIIDGIEKFLHIIPNNKVLVLTTADDKTITDQLSGLRVLNKPFEFKDFEFALSTV